MGRAEKVDLFQEIGSMKGMGMRGVRDEDSSEGGVEMKVVDLRRNFSLLPLFFFSRSCCSINCFAQVL